MLDIERINAEATISRHREEPALRTARQTRETPHSAESEMGFIASAFMAPAQVRGIATHMGLTADWFHIPSNRTIWKAFADIVDEGLPFDAVTLIQKLRDAKELDSVGGPSNVMYLFGYVGTSAHARHYAQTLEEKHTLREIIKRCTRTIERAYEDQGSIPQIVEGYETDANQIALRRHKPQSGSVKESVMNCLTRCANGYTEEDWGVSTGYTSLDLVVRGMRKGHMWVVAGASSAGKTSFALNLIHSVCVKRGHPTTIFTMETNRDEIVEVLMQIGSGVNVDHIAKGIATAGEQRLFNQAAEALAKAPLIIHDDTDLSMCQVRSIVRREKPRFALIDYAQLMTGSQRKYERQDQEVAEISRSTKKMCGEMELTGILLSQLNDDGKMAGSRSILKDSDQSLIVEDGKSESEKLIKVVKQRRGKKTTLSFRWNGPSQEFIQKSLSGDT